MTKPVCSGCGTPIPADGPGRLCPACLLLAGSEEPEVFFTGGGEPDRPPPPEEIQKLFPHLEIVALIGQGGMGAVYEARQRGLNRQVALKILWAPSNPDAEFEQRFAREGRALAQLSHPNIVTVHDAGQSGPYFWLVMEYVDGVDLRDLIRAGPIEPARALTIVMQMCAALDYAHKQNVVHRDIKPENVLVTRSGRVKIADFGLAKMLGRKFRGASLTRSEQTMGTPHYIAPEQIEHPKHVDHRADIYSLGVVMYEVLTGELPIGRFMPPSRRVQVDVRLDEIVLKALQKQPERRYQKASEVGAAIRNMSEARPQPRARTERPPARKTWPLYLGAAAAAALAVLWLASGQLGILNAGKDPVSLTPEEQFEHGRRLVMVPESLEEGLRHLAAAHAQAPTLAGLAPLYAGKLRENSQRLGRLDLVDEALACALEAQAVEPSPESERFVQAANKAALARWSRRVTLDSPRDGALLAQAEVVVSGRLQDFPPDAKLELAGVALLSLDSFEERRTGLAEGAQDLGLAIRAPNGVSIPLPCQVIVDTRAPELAVESPQANQSVPGTFLVTGKVTDSTQTEVLVSGGTASATVPGSGSWELEVTLEAGPQVLVLEAVDAAQNRSRLEIAVIVDTTRPTIEEPPGGFDLTWSVSRDGPFLRVADDGRIGSVTLDGEPLSFDRSGRVRLPTSAEAREGARSSHLLEVFDSAGNLEALEITLCRDESRPEIALEQTDFAVFPGQTFRLRGSVTDSSPCLFVQEGSETHLEGREFEIPFAIPPQAIPGEKLKRTVLFRDSAGNEELLARIFEIVAPCTQCRQEDDYRGKCTECSGTGSVNACPSCKNGTDEVRCPRCVGKGKESCVTCNGSGEGEPVACDRCDGNGMACKKCDGKGYERRDCSSGDCRSGWVVSYTVSGVAKQVPHNACEGTGKRNYPCVDCDHDGRVRCIKKGCKAGKVATKCPDCINGRSKIDCTECGGRKQVPAPCSKCDGGKRRSPCKTCAGRKTCLACEGTGRADHVAGGASTTTK